MRPNKGREFKIKLITRLVFTRIHHSMGIQRVPSGLPCTSRVGFHTRFGLLSPIFQVSHHDSFHWSRIIAILERAPIIKNPTRTGGRPRTVISRTPIPPNSTRQRSKCAPPTAAVRDENMTRTATRPIRKYIRVCVYKYWRGSRVNRISQNTRA